MFKKVFKKGNENELNIYDLAGRHINTLKELLDEYISKNKYKHQHELFELFDLLIEIEEDKRYLEQRNDPKIVFQVSELYKKLEECLIKIKNKLLCICQNESNSDLLNIKAEYIVLKELLNRNINLPAIKAVTSRLQTSACLTTDKIFEEILFLENQIYIRKENIKSNEMHFR